MVAQKETIQRVSSSYIDIFVNEIVCTVAHVRAHLEQFGLTSKNPELLNDDTRVLSLHAWEEQDKL